MVRPCLSIQPMACGGFQGKGGTGNATGRALVGDQMHTSVLSVNVGTGLLNPMVTAVQSQ